jgi:hypothetical protein
VEQGLQRKHVHFRVITEIKLGVYVWVFSEETEVSFLSSVLGGRGRTEVEYGPRCCFRGVSSCDALLLWPVSLWMLLYLGTALPCGLQD